MRAYSRDKEKETAFLEFSKLLEEDLEKRRQIEQDWDQRKYELSNDYVELNIDKLAADIRRMIFVLEEEEKKRQIEQDWDQRKYELSKDHSKDVAFGDLRKNLSRKNYFPKHLAYNTDKSGCPILKNHHSREEVEKDSGLLEFLKVRHNLPARTRIVLD
jgi:hypothetical protein